MGVFSVRLSEEEEKIVKRLSEVFDEDRSVVIKRSLHDMYEDQVDLEEVYSFEKRAEKKPPRFVSGEDILKGIS